MLSSKRFMTTSTVIATSILTTFVTACSPMRSSYVDDSMISKSSNTVISDDLSCLIDAPDYTLATDMMAFQVTSSGGLNLGFNFVSGLLKAIGVKFQASSGELDLAMHLYNPMKPQTSLVDTTGSATSKEIDFGVDFSIYMITANANYFYTTPVASLSNDALRATLENTRTKIAALGTPWSTKVYKVVDDKQFLVHVGTKANMLVGDKFNIYNTSYEWSGASCASTFLMARKVSTTPIAIAKVTQVDADSALLEITSSNGTIKRGDMVTMKSLASAQPSSGQTPSRTLLSSVRLSDVSNGNLTFDDNGTAKSVNLSPFVLQQLKDIVAEYGLVSHN